MPCSIPEVVPPVDIPTSSCPQDTETTIDPEENKFIRDIHIKNADSKYMPARAHLDTQCPIGNWVSSQLVEDLGKEVSEIDMVPTILDANGNHVKACGIIVLHWKWSPNGTKMHKQMFYVFDNNCVDVIIGVKTLNALDLVRPNEPAFLLTMTAHKRETVEEKIRIASLEEQQRKEKAALEAQRQASQQRPQQKNGQSSRAPSQQPQRR